MAMSLVVPAVLPSSRADLEEKLRMFARLPTVSRVQIDVVDGKFATLASWPYFAKATQGTPYPELEAMVQKGEMLPNLDRIEYEIDLMCFDAERAADAWLALGATRLTFHAEGVTDLPRFLASMHTRYGGDFISFGLALNVASSLALIEPYLDQIDYVQFMGIATIGRQAQPFDRRVLEKVRSFHTRHPEIPVQVDGGVSLESARELVSLSVSNLVVGSLITRANDPAALVAQIEAFHIAHGVELY